MLKHVMIAFNNTEHEAAGMVNEPGAVLVLGSSNDVELIRTSAANGKGGCS